MQSLLDRLRIPRYPSAARGASRRGDEAPQILVEHVARERGLARPRHAGHDDESAERHAAVEVLQVVQARAFDRERRRAVTGPRRGCSGCFRGSARKRPVTDAGLRINSAVVPSATTQPPRLPAPGPRSMTCSARRIVSSSCSTTSSVLPFGLQTLERAEQDAVVARMQADGGLVEDVANAAQVGAQLRREPDALRFAAGERGRGAVERQVREPDLAQESEAARELGDDVPSDLRLSSLEAEIAEEFLDGRHGHAATGRQWSGPGTVTASAVGLSRRPSHAAQGIGSPSYQSFHQISSPVCSSSKPESLEPVP